MAISGSRDALYPLGDEVLHTVAVQLGAMTKHEVRHVHDVLSPLIELCQVDETVVRDAAVASIKQLLAEPSAAAAAVAPAVSRSGSCPLATTNARGARARPASAYIATLPAYRHPTRLSSLSR